MSRNRLVLSSALLAALVAAAYLIWGPASQDLAAATFRADLFSDHGFVVWSNDWYSGHYLLSYSVLYPPFGALLGPRLAGSVAAVVAAAIFALLAHRRFGDRAVIGSLWFAAGISAWLLTGRMPFMLAVPFGLAALLPREGWSLVLAALSAALCGLASPVAGLFAVVAGAAIALAGEWRRGAAIALGAGIPIGVLNLAFPTGGQEPFVFSSFFGIPLLAAVVIWLVPAEHRALRIGVLLYALLGVILLFVPNAVGGNVVRLGALLGGPVLALILWPRHRLLALALSIPLLYWQLVAPARDLGKAAGDPATERAYFEPLDAELASLAATRGTFRTEIPPTRNRWEAAYVAPTNPIARGWLRQLESDDFELFTGGRLTPAAYRSWLERHGVSFVAVADAKLDYLATDEVALIDAGLDYLKPVWSGEHWRLYRVRGSRRWGLESMGVEQQGPDRFEVRRPRAGTLPINWSDFWSVDGGDGCLAETADGETGVRASSTAPITVEISFGGDPCSA